MVTHQLQVRCRPGKVRRPETEIPPSKRAADVVVDKNDNDNDNGLTAADYTNTHNVTRNISTKNY